MPDDTRFVVEKPFGTDVDSARELHDEMVAALGEHRLLVVDHFLAKASVENLLTVRTNNALFDRVLDRHSVDRIEIELREQGDVADRARSTNRSEWSTTSCRTTCSSSPPSH